MTGGHTNIKSPLEMHLLDTTKNNCDNSVIYFDAHTSIRTQITADIYQTLENEEVQTKYIFKGIRNKPDNTYLTQYGTHDKKTKRQDLQTIIR